MVLCRLWVLVRGVGSMSKEGWIQTKVNDLEEQLNNIEKNISILLEKIEEKEKKINEKIENLKPMIERCEKIENERNDSQQVVKSIIEDAQHAAIVRDSMLRKSILEDINKNLEVLKKHINFTIADNTTIGNLLHLYLVKKGIIDPKEFVDLINKEFDIMREMSLEKPAQDVLKFYEGE